jgi:hypothetical protein
VTLTACQPSDDSTPDSSVSTDQAAPDLAARDFSSPHDFSLDFSSPDSSPDVDASPCSIGTSRQQLVADTITLPQQRYDFAMDLNGDGTMDNQFGYIVGALASQAINMQMTLDTALANGTEVLLVEETANDPQFANDACAGSTLYKGNNQAPGSPPYHIDPTVAAGVFTGTIASDAFSSTSPLMPPDTQLTLYLPLFGARLTALPLHGAHLTYDFSGGKLIGGRINGAIRESDLQSSFIPDMVAGFNALAAAGGSSATQILALFDNGGDPNSPGCTTTRGCNGTPVGHPSCRNPTGYGPPARQGKCADTCDNIIDICEVSTNAIIKASLALDVQLFQNGAYDPSPANTQKDSYSIGIAFTAVPTTF